MARDYSFGTEKKSITKLVFILKVGILGCGWIGKRLAFNLLSNNYELYTTNRFIEKKTELDGLGCNAFVVNFEHNDFDISVSKTFRDLDAIIISVSISKLRKLSLQKSIFIKVNDFLSNYKSKLILLSSIGVYPDNKLTINENHSQSLNKNILEIENLVYSKFSQLNILRLGGLMGDDRSLDKYYKNLAQLKQGEDKVNYVHYEDVIGVIKKLIKSDFKGEIFNVVAPFHPTKYEVLSHLLKTEIPKHKPKKNHRIILSDKLINSLDYTFKHPNPIDFE